MLNSIVYLAPAHV